MSIERFKVLSLDSLVTRERRVVLKCDQKQAIVRLLNGKNVPSMLPTRSGKSIIFTVFGIVESENGVSACNLRTQEYHIRADCKTGRFVFGSRIHPREF